VKHPINRILNYFGANLNRFTRSPFEYLLSIPRYKETIIELLGYEFRIADTLSFYHSYREIFLDEIYKFPSNKKDPVILDCGANYGTSIVYFKQLFPDAKIVGVEADPTIFQLLKSNIDRRPYENMTLLNKVIATGNNPIRFYSDGADGGRVHSFDKPRRTNEIEPVALDDLIDDEIDLLKMDIEGSEVDVICALKKINRVKLMFVEYHSFSDSEQTLFQLLEVLSNNNFRYYISTILCAKKPFQNVVVRHGMDLQLNIFAIRKH